MFWKILLVCLLGCIFFFSLLKEHRIYFILVYAYIFLYLDLNSSLFLFDIQMKQSYQKNMQSHGWGNIRLLMGIVSYSDLIGLSIGFFFFYYRTIPILIILFLSHWGGPTLEILVCCCLSSWNCKRFSSTGPYTLPTSQMQKFLTRKNLENLLPAELKMLNQPLQKSLS